MDRNSVIGLLMIGAILIGFSIYNQPTKEQLEAAKYRQDSIARVQEITHQQEAKAALQTKLAQNTVATDSAISDSARIAMDADRLGAFALTSQGMEEVITLENKVLKLSFTTHGGRIKSAELKKYKTFDGKPVILFESDSTRFGLNFFSQNRNIATNDLYFTPLSGIEKGSVAMRLNAGENKYLEYKYTLEPDSYMVKVSINMVNLNQVIAANSSSLELDWSQRLNRMEKDLKSERINSTVYYQFTDEEVDHLSETESASDELKTKVKWVSMKQHFFTQVLIADKGFDKPTRLEVRNPEDEEENYVKTMSAGLTIPYNHTASESFGMQMYIGPNHYQTLKHIGYSLEKQIPLGWGIFGWVNRFLVIPVFNFLDSFHLNYGIIILILTILIKILLLPLTYKAYLSQAKMKVLKPEMEEIQGKFKEEPVKLQQEMMGLYRKAGVSPMGGCWPMLLQLPILFAMLRFFPSSIELRQQGFLWANDLSTYDSILDLPFTIPFYGAHVSLFTLLMTASTLALTFFNSQTTATNPQMKWMMYLMPVFFMGFLNSFSAGLNYYYFLANMISIGQQFLFRSFVDEAAIHAQIQANKKRPAAQGKSKFQQRLENMAKERGYKLPNK